MESVDWEKIECSSSLQDVFVPQEMQKLPSSRIPALICSGEEIIE